MLILRDVNVSLDYCDRLKQQCAKELRTTTDNIVSLKVIRKSVDARKKHDVHFVYSFELELKHDEQKIVNRCKRAQIKLSETKDNFVPNRDVGRPTPLIIGSGPAGIFCALEMIKYGYAPIIVERGKPVEDRINDVEAFNLTGVLNENSNIQFGEGGAGTFSDGKLNTGISSSFRRSVLETYVRFGANESILYDAQPHIGTDVLRTVAVNIRKHIINNGGQFMFSTKLIDVVIKDGCVTAAVLESNNSKIIVECDTIILAIGHSARDTFEMLNARHIPMEQKPFAIGIRIEHLQEDINKGRYGRFWDHPSLSSASYNLSTKIDNVGVFTFCMCPGGTVVAASSERYGIVTNGMSCRARDAVNANSAVLVGVSSDDFDGDDVFAGVRLQRKIERAAYNYSESYKAPCQRLEDFLNCTKTTSFGNVLPSYTGGVQMGDINSCIPQRTSNLIRIGLSNFGQMLTGFDHPDALLTAPETRSSSPIRILRGEDMQSSIRGLYPCGEGAGYAGGITSAAVDGIRTARAVLIKV